MKDGDRWRLGPFFFRGPYTRMRAFLGRGNANTPLEEDKREYNAALEGLVQSVEKEQALFDQLGQIGRLFGNAADSSEQKQFALAALEAIHRHYASCGVSRDSLVVVEALFADIENLLEGRE